MTNLGSHFLVRLRLSLRNPISWLWGVGAAMICLPLLMQVPARDPGLVWALVPTAFVYAQLMLWVAAGSRQFQGVCGGAVPHGTLPISPRTRGLAEALVVASLFAIPAVMTIAMVSAAGYGDATSVAAVGSAVAAITASAWWGSRVPRMTATQTWVALVLTVVPSSVVVAIGGASPLSWLATAVFAVGMAQLPWERFRPLGPAGPRRMLGPMVRPGLGHAHALRRDWWIGLRQSVLWGGIIAGALATFYGFALDEGIELLPMALGVGLFVGVQRALGLPTQVSRRSTRCAGASSFAKATETLPVARHALARATLANALVVFGIAAGLAAVVSFAAPGLVGGVAGRLSLLVLLLAPASAAVMLEQRFGTPWTWAAASVGVALVFMGSIRFAVLERPVFAGGWGVLVGVGEAVGLVALAVAFRHLRRARAVASSPRARRSPRPPAVTMPDDKRRAV